MTGQGLSKFTFCQVGLVVRNIERSAQAYSQALGLPVPEIILTDPLEVAHTNYRGSPSEGRAKLAFFNLGQVSIELIEPVGGPSTWQEFLDTKGEGVHHLAFQIKDTGQVVEFLADQGVSFVQQGDYTGGMYTYLDATKPLGVILELLENF